MQKTLSVCKFDKHLEKEKGVRNSPNELLVYTNVYCYRFFLEAPWSEVMFQDLY